MLVLHRMALSLSSHHLFTSNRIPGFSSMKPLLSSVARKRILVKENGYGYIAVCRNSSSGFSSSAIATDSVDSASATGSRAAEEEEEEKEASLEKKLVLPTNESSERLLRIRHTVSSQIWLIYIHTHTYIYIYIKRINMGKLNGKKYGKSDSNKLHHPSVL